MKSFVASVAVSRTYVRTLVAATMTIVALTFAVPADAQERGFDDESDVPLKVGDKVELRSGQSGVVVSVDGAKVKVLLTVPAVDLVIPGQPRRPAPRRPEPLDPRGPDSPRPGFTEPDRPQPREPEGTREPQLPYVGTWLSTDRAIVIKNATEMRVFWTDEKGVTRIDDGKYTLEGDLKTGETFYFTSGEKTWPWKLTDLNETKLTMSHAEVGTRVFQRVAPNAKHPLAGTYNVQYTTDRGRRGTSKFYLYQDGMYVIDEYAATGKLDHREFGSWTADFEKGTMAITFPYNKKINTSSGTVQDTGPTSFAFKFSSLDGEKYTYNCTRVPTRPTSRQGGGFGTGNRGTSGFGNGGTFRPFQPQP